MKSKFTGTPKPLWQGEQPNYDYFEGKKGKLRRTCHADTKSEATKILRNTFGNDVININRAWDEQ